MDYNRANRVRLLPTHPRGPLDSVVLFDLWHSIPDQRSAVSPSYQSHWCFEQAFFPSILCLPHPQGHADCEITWQSAIKINSNIKPANSKHTHYALPFLDVRVKDIHKESVSGSWGSVRKCFYLGEGWAYRGWDHEGSEVSWAWPDYNARTNLIV